MSKGTFSKHPLRYPKGYPLNIVGGHGAHINTDAGTYIDWVQGLGAAGVFGHNKIKLGTGAFHLPHCREQELAAKFAEIIPWAEDIRLCLNGTDAVAGAVRLARAVTGRDVIVIFDGAYHGASTGDWFAWSKAPARGIPKVVREAYTTCTLQLPWNDVDTLMQRISDDVAAIVFEIPLDDPTPEFVQLLHACRDRFGSLLIADEVVTGFRFGLQGACGRYEIKPDLACYGKALGSGYPVAVLAGRRELMREFDLAHTQEPVFMSFTHAGNSVCVDAALWTIRAIQDHPDCLLALQNAGVALGNMFLSLADDFAIKAQVQGQTERFIFEFLGSSEASAVCAAVFIQQCAKSGVLFGAVNFPTESHCVEPVHETEIAIKRAMEYMVNAVAPLLDGAVPKPLYLVR